MNELIDRINKELSKIKKMDAGDPLRERYDFFVREYAGTKIEEKIDSYYPTREFYGETGIAILFKEGMMTGRVTVPPYITGTHKMTHQRNQDYTISALKRGETYSELSAQRERQGTYTFQEEIVTAFSRTLNKKRNKAVILVPSGEPMLKEREPEQLKDRQLLVVRNDIITPASAYVKHPENARDTLFCALYVDMLSRFSIN